MISYYKRIESGKLIAIGTNCGGTEITEAEYNALLAEIRTKAQLVDRLYLNEITADDVPAEWRDEIVRRVNERRATEAEMQDDEISPDELMSMMEGIL